MAPIPPAAAHAAPSDGANDSNGLGRSGAPPPVRARGQFLLLLSSLALLHVSNPLAWGGSDLGLWWPSAGIGLALIAWFGPRAALCVALDGLLVVLQAMLWRGVAEPLREAAEAALGAGVLQASWWLFHTRCRGARGLADPRSAMLFLFLVPGVGVGAWAVLHTALPGLTAAEPSGDWRTALTAFWLSRSLGVMVLAPWLLAGLTPWLARRGLVRPEAAGGAAKEPTDVVGGEEPLTWGDGLEVVGLAVGAAALTGLAVQAGRDQPAGWPLWGTPLLLIVWAGLRQGLRGSTLVAATSAGLSLLLLGRAPAGDAPLLLASNLLGQCIVALLVSASAGWVRGSEDRYRQVMAHVPVVIYSARFLRPGRPPLPAGEGAAEVTLVSSASLPLLHCPPEELLGPHARWLGRVHPDDREVLRAAVSQVGRQQQPVVCEYRLARCGKDASGGDHADPARVRWVRDTLAPRLDAGGVLVGWDGVLTDITPQRVLADDLRRTTSMLHALVGNLPAGVFFVQGPRGHPILVNARARQLLGQREDMAAGLEHLAEVYRLHRPDGSLYPVEELPVFLALREGLTTMREDIVVHRPDGRRTPLVTWAAPITLARNGPDRPEAGPPPEPDAAVWVLEDLTALHQAEAARLDTETRLRTVLETMAEALMVLDHDRRIIDCNAAAATFFGHPPERLRGMTLKEHDWTWLGEDGDPLPPEAAPGAVVLHKARPVRNLVLGVVTGYPAGVRPPKSEEVRWLLVNGMPLGAGVYGENRGPAGVVLTYVDITSAVQARRMIRESEERYRELVESLPLMVIQADLDLRVTYVNPALRAITGYELGEIAEPELWQTLVHPDDLSVLLGLAREALEGRGNRAEFRYRAKDGSEKFGLAFGEPRRRSDGTVIGSTTLVVDVTRERQLEQDLLRAQRLELVGRISGGIAHDFNNLLSVVLSLTELIGSNLPGGHAAHADLGRIREATEQAANLAGQLLTFSKQRRVAMRRVEVNDVARRTLELLRASLPPGVELRADLAAGELFIQADETQVQQVLMNLCLNARDAMPEGGPLHVRTELVPGDPARVRLSVRDQGTGMTEEVKARLFDPFFSTKERGTGLGLAVVRQIVESHGGHVEFTSEPGRGSQFEVFWPYSSG